MQQGSALSPLIFVFVM